MQLNLAHLSRLKNGSVELIIAQNHYCGELSGLSIEDEKLSLKFAWVAKALRSVWTKTPLFDLELDLKRTFAADYGDGIEFNCPSRKTIIRIFPHGAATVRKEDILESLYSIARESLPDNVETFISSVQVPGMMESIHGNSSRTTFRR